MSQACLINPAVSQSAATTALHRGQEKAIQENMPPENYASAAAQTPASQSTSQSPRKRSLEEIYGRNWLLRLSSLPSGLYTQTIDRLIRGETVYAVTRWLMAQPDRGGLKNVGEWTLNKYLNVLAKEVKRKKRENPPPSPAEVKSKVVELKLLATPQSLPRRHGSAYESLESFLGDRVEKHNRTLMLWGLLGHYYEQLERLRMTEEHYHHDLKLPTHPLCRARVQIGSQLRWIMVELRKNDELELMRQKLALGSAAVAPTGLQEQRPDGRRETGLTAASEGR